MIIVKRSLILFEFPSSGVCIKYECSREGLHFVWIPILRGMQNVLLYIPDLGWIPILRGIDYSREGFHFVWTPDPQRYAQIELIAEGT